MVSFSYPGFVDVVGCDALALFGCLVVLLQVIVGGGILASLQSFVYLVIAGCRMGLMFS